MDSTKRSRNPQRRKRRRSRGMTTRPETRSGTCTNDGVPSTIRALMGSDVVILPLFDFVRQYAPNLPDLEPLEDTKDHTRLRNTLVSPSQSMRPCRCRKVECVESLSSLVDDVIWSLVQLRSTDKTRRNVLCQGYVSASENMSQTQDIRPCLQMRPGVLCTHMNDNVSFCKTSSFAQTLHRLVGDDVLRSLLLHTSLFLPVEQDWDRPKQNYLLLCGPPLQVTGRNLLKRKGAELSNSETNGKGRKRRKRTDKTEAQSASMELNPNAVIRRHSLFYSSFFVPKVGLPSTHILNQRPEKYGLLLSAMLCCTSNKGRKRWKRVRELGIPVCQQIFRRHAMCNYHRLLNRYCPLPAFCQEPSVPTLSNNTRDAMQQEEVPLISFAALSAAHSPSDGVVSFLRAVLRRVFPLEFWGSEHNLDKVFQVAENFVKLRRQEQLPNKALMNGIRVKDVLWISGRADMTASYSRDKTWSKTLHEAATVRMQNVMNWLFTQYLMPLLRSVFYVTESEFSAKRVLYYRKPVWSMFRSLSMKKLLVRQYRELSANEAESRVVHQKMGFSRLRLLPKKSGVRALATLSKREFADFEKGRGTDFAPACPDVESTSNLERDANVPGKKRARHDIKGPKEVPKRRKIDTRFCSTNAILGDVFKVLRHERDRQPHIFGAGVFGLNEVYPKYRCFLEKFRQTNLSSKAQSSSSAATRLYFASVDITQCYDNINQEHLLDILPKLLSEGEYLIQNFSVIHPFESTGRTLKRHMKRIGPPESYYPFPGAVDELTSDYNRSVFINGVSCSLVRKEDVMTLLQEHLRSHIVVMQGRYGNRFLLQSTGIPQGSVLSTLLCNYYYGDVEKALLGDTTGLRTASEIPCTSCTTGTNNCHATLLVRIVDDFLLVTTDRELSIKFLTVMSAGNSEFGVKINKEKTLVSDAGLMEVSGGTGDNRQCDVVDAGEDGKTVFPWCGMLFDTENGEISIDFSRFAGDRATDGLTVDRSGGEGRRLDIRMKSFVRPRCLPMLFDPRINSTQTVGINFMQVLLLCAVKTVSYVVDGMDGGAQKNGNYIARCIDNVILYTYKLITRRLHQENTPNQSSQEYSLHLKRKDAMWLGWSAFRSIFIGTGTCSNVVALLTLKCNSKVNDKKALQAIENAACQRFNSQMKY